MSNAVKDEIDKIVALLDPPDWYRRRPASMNEAQAWSDRLGEAENRVESLLDRSPANCLPLLVALFDADAAGNALAPRLVAFIKHDDLPVLVEKLMASIGRSGGGGFLRWFNKRPGQAVTHSDVERLLREIALQRPEVVRPQYHRPEAQVQDGGEVPVALPAAHLIFDGGPPQMGLRPIERRHPTWHLPAKGHSYRMGGPGRGWCQFCKQPQIHLITLDGGVQTALGLRHALVLETCVNCLSAPVFYRHDEDGWPTRIASAQPAEPYDFKNVPLKEQTVRLAETPKRWLRQEGGNLFRIGGLPTWIQEPEIPNAPETGRKMQFLLQLNSYLPDIEGGSLQFGDSGLLYVFWDSESRVSCHFIQCY